MSAKRTLGHSDKDYKEDTYKSLDTVIQERGYKKPPSYSRESRFGNDGLRIPDRNEKLMLDPPRSRPSSSIPSASSSTFSGRTTGKLDAKSNSLDAIITDRGILDEDDRGPSKGYRESFEKRKRVRREFEEKVRQDEIDSDSTNANGYRPKRPRTRGVIKMTPYNAVNFFVDAGMEVDIKMGKRVKYATEENLLQKWRCVVKCGAIQGIAESFGRAVAREIACLEFLKLLKEVYPDGQIPEHELPDEIFLDPKVYEAIKVLEAERGAKFTVEIGNDDRAIGFGDKPAGMYKCTYHLDEQRFIGRSASREMARRKAAGQLYETLTGTEFPLAQYSTGADCDTFEEYDFSESKTWID